MLIEFFGLPGSGKTTLSHDVANLLRARGITVSEDTYNLDHRFRRPGRLLVKLSHFLYYLGRNPRRGLFAISSIILTKQATLIDLCKSLLNWMFIASISSRERRDDTITILDQGISQAVWSIGFAAQRETWLEMALAKDQWEALKPDMIVHIRADHQTIANRLATRKIRTSRLDDLGQDRRYLRHAQDRTEAILHCLKTSDIRLIEIDNVSHDHLADHAGQVADAIAAMLEQKYGTRRPASRQDPLDHLAGAYAHPPFHKR